MKIEYEEIQFNGTVRFSILPLKNISQIYNTTPNVFSQEFYTNDGTARTVANFLGGSQCQIIRILGDGNLTIANNSNIKTNTGANKLLAANKMYRFTYINQIWYEDA